VIIRVKFFASVPGVCFKMFFKSLYRKWCKFQKDGGCWSTFHKPVLIRSNSILKSFGIAENLDTSITGCFHFATPLVERNFKRFLPHTGKLWRFLINCEDSKYAVNNLRRGLISKHVPRNSIGTRWIDRLDSLNINKQRAVRSLITSHK